MGRVVLTGILGTRESTKIAPRRREREPSSSWVTTIFNFIILSGKSKKVGRVEREGEEARRKPCPKKKRVGPKLMVRGCTKQKQPKTRTQKVDDVDENTGGTHDDFSVEDPVLE